MPGLAQEGPAIGQGSLQSQPEIQPQSRQAVWRQRSGGSASKSSVGLNREGFQGPLPGPEPGRTPASPAEVHLCPWEVGGWLVWPVPHWAQPALPPWWQNGRIWHRLAHSCENHGDKRPSLCMARLRGHQPLSTARGTPHPLAEPPINPSLSPPRDPPSPQIHPIQWPGYLSLDVLHVT